MPISGLKEFTYTISYKYFDEGVLKQNVLLKLFWW